MKIPPKGFYTQQLRNSKFGSLKDEGDFIVLKFDGTDAGAHKIRDAAYKYGKYHKIKIYTRKRPDCTMVVYHGGSNGEK